MDRDGDDRPLLLRLDRSAGPDPRRPGRRPPAHLLALRLRERGRPEHPAERPGRPALGLHVPDRQRGLGADPPLLDQLHDLGPRLQPLLRLPELLRLLDAAAGPGGQPGAADRRLGLRRLRLLRADQLLVPAHHGDQGRNEGLRDQRDRRRRHGARRVLHLPRAGHLRPALDLQQGARARSTPTRASWSRSACCCWSAPSPSPRRSRSTPGSPTRWRARLRSPP